jgi:peptide/nickel transport system substrate-binding protein
MVLGMRKIIALSFVAAGFFLNGCKCSNDTQQAQDSKTAAQGGQESEFPRQESLYIGGIQWGEPTTFNPLNDSASAWPCRQPNKLVYETLFEYNPQNGKLDPLLAESMVMKDDGIEVTLQKDAKWNDGKPVTAWDVRFTFHLGKTFKNAPISQVWDYLDDVKVMDAADQTPPAPDAAITGEYPKKLFFAYKAGNKNPLKLLTSLQQDFIYPRHVFEVELNKQGGDFQKLVAVKFDQNPVASGPYRLHSFSAEKIITVRDDNYWGNKVLYEGKTPVPKYVIHQMYKSNDQYSIALQQGRLDIASAFIPRIWLKEKENVYAWLKKPPYYDGASIPMLFINVTNPVLGDVQLRKAMAQAINYADIKELAVSGYSSDLKSGAILPYGVEAKYYSEEDASKLGSSVYNPEKAKQILKEAGYQSVFDNSGALVEMKAKDGKKVPTIMITSPAGWTDWEAIVRIVVKSLRAVGIDARENFVDGNVFWSILPKGEFDLIMWTPVIEASPAQPWSRFEFILSSQGLLPVGEKMWRNYGRFNDPKSPKYVKRFDELLTKIPQITDEQELVKAYKEINALYMEHQPTLPLVYRPEQFYQYSTRVWENFPTGDNPYAPSFLAGYRAGTKMLWHIKPAAAK